MPTSKPVLTPFDLFPHFHDLMNASVTCFLATPKSVKLLLFRDDSHPTFAHAFTLVVALLHLNRLRPLALPFIVSLPQEPGVMPISLSNLPTSLPQA